jgi:hypothetical protein
VRNQKDSPSVADFFLTSILIRRLLTPFCIPVRPYQTKTMCFAVFSSVFRIQTTKKASTPWRRIAEPAGFKLFYSFPPPRNFLRPPVWPHVTLEAFSMVGVTCYKRRNFKFILGTSVEKCDYSIL